ncbi:formamidase [Monoraphidium neglectum]|uniref:Formamidase n=1 Tax=Monoraphidium neglectum TaxID=145388 RepID=A0A0D2KES4_9CHLO|nr:formamidase [Monoraphidium neglectum]KIY94358.1 formamidase [Monoraphidium neglectum]|eukprot:XP_013893378.1 formamidase [Monoraphidium neglectum]
MPPRTPIPVVKVDPSKPAWEQETPLHNRWHPDIPHVRGHMGPAAAPPPRVRSARAGALAHCRRRRAAGGGTQPNRLVANVAEVTEGDLFRVECIDWTGGQIKDDDSALDMKNVDLSVIHWLSGPIRVVDKDGEPAKPGDLLCVEICNLGPLPGDEWGYTGIFDRDNGGGFLTDHFPNAGKAIWHFDGIYAQSRHIPGVRFAGIIHPGLIGTAPSKELLDIWNEREGALVEAGPEATTLGGILHTRPLGVGAGGGGTTAVVSNLGGAALEGGAAAGVGAMLGGRRGGWGVAALLPLAKGAFLGKVPADSEDFQRIASEAARTVPGREHGGCAAGRAPTQRPPASGADAQCAPVVHPCPRRQPA